MIRTLIGNDALMQNHRTIERTMEAFAGHNNIARMTEVLAANSAIKQVTEALAGNSNITRMAEVLAANSAIKQATEALAGNSNIARMAEVLAANNNITRIAKAFAANSNAIRQAAEIASTHQSTLAGALQSLTRPGHLNALISSIDESLEQPNSSSKNVFPEESKAEDHLKNLASTNSLESFANTLQEVPDTFLQFLLFLFFLAYSWIPNSLSETFLNGFDYVTEQQIPTLLNALLASFVYDLLKGSSKNSNQRVLPKDIKALACNIPQEQSQHLRFITRSPLKIYLTPNSKSPVLFTITCPQVVTLVSAQDAWAEVLYEHEDKDKVLGWVFIRYLSKF